MKINQLTSFKSVILITITAFLFSCSSNKYSYEGKIRTDFEFGGSPDEEVRYSEEEIVDEEVAIVEDAPQEEIAVEEENLTVDEPVTIEKEEVIVQENVERRTTNLNSTESTKSKKEIKREKRKQLKKVLKDYKKDKKKNKNSSSDVALLLLVIIAILLPPLAVYLFEDAITDNFWIDLILTLLFWLPGIIYALIIIL